MIIDLIKKKVIILRDLFISIYWRIRKLIKKEIFIYNKIQLLIRKKTILGNFINLLNIFLVDSTKIISARIYGRLGNQLFQIANALAYAWKYSLIPQFKKTKKKDRWWPEYWDTVFRKIPTRNILPLKLYVFKEKTISEYHEIPKPSQIINLKNHNGIIFNGYFHCAKYFHKYREKLLTYLFFIDPLEKDYLKKKYPEIFLGENITIGLHIRRGDYTKLPHLLSLCDTHYYQNSIIYFQKKFGEKNLKIIVFSNDPSWCKDFLKNKFPELKALFPQEKDYLDLYLMSCCKHQIIANSTFSWWAAYFNNYSEKIIIAPKNWYSPQETSKWDHYYMEEWIRF